MSQSSKKPLQQSNSFMNSSSPVNVTKTSEASSQNNIAAQTNDRRMTIGFMDLADLLKQAASPAPPSLPNARRMTVDSAALEGLINSIESRSTITGQSFEDSQRKDQSPTEGVEDRRRETLDPAEILALIRQASTPITDDNESVPPERRQVIDVQGLQNVFDFLTMDSPCSSRAGSSIAISSSSKKMKVSAVCTDNPEMNDSGVSENDDGTTADDSMRQTIDTSALAEVVQRASSAVDATVPGERRLTVDADAMQQIRDLVFDSPEVRETANGTPIEGASTPLSTVAHSDNRRTTIDAGEFYELLRVALSPAVSVDGSAPTLDTSELKSTATASASPEKDTSGSRRQTIDPSSFADLLANISSANAKKKSAVQDDAEQHQEENEPPVLPLQAATPDSQRRRRMTVDGAWFSDMLKTVATPGSSAKKSVNSAASPLVSSGPSAAKSSDADSAAAEDNRRMTIDAGDMLELLIAVGAQSPNPASPYVSPPVSARTRTARKSPAPSPASAKKRKPKSPTTNTKKAAVSSPSTKASASSTPTASPRPGKATKHPPPSPSSSSSPVVAANEGPRRDSLQGIMAGMSSPPPRKKRTEEQQSQFPQAPTSALRSCLSSRKFPRSSLNQATAGSSTPGGEGGAARSVVFGAAAAAEFRRTDPSSTLTPMHRDQVRAHFPSMSASSEEPSEELQEEEDVSPGGTVSTRLVSVAAAHVSTTKVNSRILAAWGDGNSEVAACGGGLEGKSLSPRRMSGKFTLPTPTSLVGSEGNSGSDMEDDNASAASSGGGSLFQSRINSVADDLDEEGSVEGSSFMQNRGHRHSSFGGAGGDQTVELEENLGAMLKGRGSGKKGAQTKKNRRLSVGAGKNDDRTMELEGGLSDLIATTGQQQQKQKWRHGQRGRRSPGARLACDDEDRTRELEAGLGDLVANASGSSGAKKRGSFGGGLSRLSTSSFASGDELYSAKSMNEDRTVELELALADLVAGLGSSDGTGSAEGPENSVRFSVNGDEDDDAHSTGGSCGVSVLTDASPLPRRNLTPFRPPAARPATSRSSTAASSKQGSRRGGEYDEVGDESSAANTSALSSTSALSTRSVAASEAFGLLLDQNAEAALLNGDGGRNLLDSSATSSFVLGQGRSQQELEESGSGSSRHTRRSLGLCEASTAHEEDEVGVASEEPAHLSEFKELLKGLGLCEDDVNGHRDGDDEVLPALSLDASNGDDNENSGGGDGSLFPYAAAVEGEVVRSACEDLLGTISETAADAMAERLWAYAQELKDGNASQSSSHAVETLLRALRKKSASNKEGGNAPPLSDEESALVDEAVQAAKQIRAVALCEWRSYEVELLKSLDERLAEAAEVVGEEAQELREARAELEGLETACQGEAELGVAARRLLSAEEASAAQDERTAEVAAEAAALEAAVQEAEEACSRAQSRSGALVLLRDEAHALTDLRKAKSAHAEGAAKALEDYQVAAALRSWVPRSLGGDEKESIVVDFPLATDVATGMPASLTLTLRLAAERDGSGDGGEKDKVAGVSWALTAGAVSAMAAAATPTKTSKRPKSMLLVGGSSGGGGRCGRVASKSVVPALQERLVNEWVGREVGRLVSTAPSSTSSVPSSSGPLLSDVPRTLNRFDALTGRLRLVLLEVKAIEDKLGLAVKFQDASEGSTEEPDERRRSDAVGSDGEEEGAEVAWGGTSDAAGLWLQIDMASMKHHCKVRMEVRVVDGYPWAPAQVRLVPLLGKCPKHLTQHVEQLFSNRQLPSGVPVLAGGGAIESAVRAAYNHLTSNLV